MHPTTESTKTSQHTTANEKRNPKDYPLRGELYPLNMSDQPTLEFWQSQTGIQDEEILKQHIIKVQTEAHAVRVLSSLSCPLPTYEC